MLVLVDESMTKKNLCRI